MAFEGSTNVYANERMPNQDNGAQRLPPLDIGNSLLDIGYSVFSASEVGALSALLVNPCEGCYRLCIQPGHITLILHLMMCHIPQSGRRVWLANRYARQMVILACRSTSRMDGTFR